MSNKEKVEDLRLKLAKVDAHIYTCVSENNYKEAENLIKNRKIIMETLEIFAPTEEEMREDMKKEIDKVGLFDTKK